MSEIRIPVPPFFSVILPNWISEIGAENFQLALLVLAGIWLAYRLTTDYAFQLFDFRDFKLAGRLILDILLPFRRRSVALIKGEEKVNDNLSARTLYGGRLSVQIDAQNGYAAALEDTAAQIRIIGPQDALPVELAGFFRLRQIVDLSDQQVVVSAATITKDGIPVYIRNAGFFCRVKGTLLDGRKISYKYCDKREIQNLVYHHWIGQDWENPAKRRKGLGDLVSTALQDFLFQHTLMEILAEFPGISESIQNVRLNRPIMEQFVIHFNENLDEHGLQLVWTGECDWLLAKEMDIETLYSIFPQAYSDWIRSQREIQNHTGIQILRDETGKLVRQILKLAQNIHQSGEQEDKIVLELAQHYAVRIQNAIHMIESRGDHVPKEWKVVSDYLNQFLT